MENPDHTSDEKRTATHRARNRESLRLFALGCGTFLAGASVLFMFYAFASLGAHGLGGKEYWRAIARQVHGFSALAVISVQLAISLLGLAIMMIACVARFSGWTFRLAPINFLIWLAFGLVLLGFIALLSVQLWGLP